MCLLLGRHSQAHRQDMLDGEAMSPCREKRRSHNAAHESLQRRPGSAAAAGAACAAAEHLVHEGHTAAKS